MGFGIRRDKYDAVVSDLVRYRSNWTCQKCLTPYAPRERKIKGGTRTGLDAAHFRGRGHGSTRLDLDNVDALCMGCHRYFTDNPAEHRAWKIARIGLQRVELLEYKSRHPLKMSQGEKDVLYQDLKRQLQEAIANYEKRNPNRLQAMR